MRFIGKAAVCIAVVVCGASVANAQVTIDQGYLDFFSLSNGSNFDIGALGGGLDASPGTKRITLGPQVGGGVS